MVNNLINKPLELEIDGKVFMLEFDNRSYAELENILGKNIFYIFDKLMTDHTLKMHDFVELAGCAMMKHHSKNEIDEVKKLLLEKPFLLMKYKSVISFAFVSPLFSPDMIKNKKGAGKKKSQAPTL